MHFAGASHACTCPSQSGPLCLFAARSACAPRYQWSRLMGFPGPCPATFQMHPVARHAILGASRAVTHTRTLPHCEGPHARSGEYHHHEISGGRGSHAAKSERTVSGPSCVRELASMSHRAFPSRMAGAARSTAAFFCCRVVSPAKAAAPPLDRARPSKSGAVCWE